MRSARTGRSGIRSRSRCLIPMAQPARHRENVGKLHLPAVQRMVSEQTRRGSNRDWMKIQWQVTKIGARSCRTDRQAPEEGDSAQGAQDSRGVQGDLLLARFAIVARGPIGVKHV